MKNTVNFANVANWPIADIRHWQQEDFSLIASVFVQNFGSIFINSGIRHVAGNDKRGDDRKAACPFSKDQSSAKSAWVN